MSELTPDQLPEEQPVKTAEPVAIAAAVQVLVMAFIALALGFGWFTWTDTQTGLVLGLYAALVGVWGAITRSKVTPA